MLEVKLRIEQADPRSDPRWQRLVQERPSSVFHSPGWMQALTDTYGLDFQAYILTDSSGNPKAGVPFSPISDIRGQRMVTLPFCDYCDPLVSEQEEWRSLITALLGEQMPVSLRCLYSPLPLADERFAIAKEAKWHGLDITPNLDALWQSLDGSARRCIKKAQRQGVAVQVAQGKEELRAFYDLHLRTRKYKYSLLAQPYCFFENIWRRFLADGLGALLVAVRGSEIIGGVLFLEWKDTVYYKFSASASDDLMYRPNDLIIWEAIKCYKQKRFRFLDFGLSDLDQPGLVRYKRKFASHELTATYLRSRLFIEDGQRAAKLLAGLSSLFSDASVPDDISEKAGALLYSYFA
ncbi:MAG: GNAT family N-acetyltransferase [Chloroflexi bacterium]|nr:GNAT family N-acetyltransferase [Chloroflexota bacterium]